MQNVVPRLEGEASEQTFNNGSLPPCSFSGRTKHDLGIRQTSVQTPALLLTVSLGSSSTSSEPHFSLCKVGLIPDPSEL